MPAIKLDYQELINEALEAPGRLGGTYNRFYRYSFFNQLLLYVQGAREPVNTYDRWMDMGRKVKPGFSKLAILVPVQGNKRGDSGEYDGESFTYFKYVKCLVPYSYTEGPELPVEPLPDLDLAKITSKLDIVEVAYDRVDGNVQGYSFENKFALNPMAVYPLKTTIHEIAHILLEHTKVSTPGAAEHRGVQEFQAEATAYLVLKQVDATDWNEEESRGYIQTWLTGLDRPNDRQIQAVFKTVDRILKAGGL